MADLVLQLQSLEPSALLLLLKALKQCSNPFPISKTTNEHKRVN